MIYDWNGTSLLQQPGSQVTLILFGSIDFTRTSKIEMLHKVQLLSCALEMVGQTAHQELKILGLG